MVAKNTAPQGIPSLGECCWDLQKQYRPLQKRGKSQQSPSRLIVVLFSLKPKNFFHFCSPFFLLRFCIQIPYQNKKSHPYR